MSEAPLLEVSGLRKHFTIRRGFPRATTITVRAVEDVSFAIRPGEAFGLVGESGCGKSTAARALLRLIEPDAGTVRFRGEDVLAARGPALKTLRRKLQIVFQDPYSSLDPRQSIGSALTEPMRVHGIAEGQEARRRAAALLEEVGLPLAALDRYPHEFSGGQRQRIGIARALTLEPELIVADEPVSALDVSVQAQVLLLLEELRRRRGLAFLFVSHDLSVVRWFCERVAVTNATAAPLVWTVVHRINGRVTTSWNSERAGDTGDVVFRGAMWNRSLAPGERTELGFCASR